jgi:cytochrome c oxidase subunit 1
MTSANKNTLDWIALVAILFPVLVIVALYMRLTQAGTLVTARGWFYPMMTLHGVGMAGVWFVGSMAAAARVLSRYTQPSERVSRFTFYGTLLGVVLLLASTFLGKFAAGWYFLYPLPFMGGWPTWATLSFLLSITVLGTVWLVWSIDLLAAIAKKYRLSAALGWQYIRGVTTTEVPAAVTIILITLIAVVACILSGVAVLVLFFVELFLGTPNDALLMKNLTFFFGHLLVNLSMYLAVGVVYDTFPKYAGRPWKNNRVVAIAWNAVLAIVLLAYFHHLYMDFVQPAFFQYIGQIASYSSAIPSAVVTIFGALALISRAPVRWNLASTMMFLGLMGWAIGGIGAVIDSTIAVNTKFHNTLWVPAHFHTYMIVGLVLIVLGYFYDYCQEESGILENLRLQKAAIALMLVGGYGVVGMFYVAGAESVPRRYAFYPPEVSQGALYSGIASAFVVVFLAGLTIYLVETGRRWVKARRGAPQPVEIVQKAG